MLPDGSICTTDWEYGGMGDPFNDIASYAISVYHDPAKSKALLAQYLEREPTRLEEARLCARMGIVGFTWGLRTVYKANMGIEFGEYGIMNYRYGKVYSNIARAMLEGEEVTGWSVGIE